LVVRAQLRVTALLLAAACTSGRWAAGRASAQDSDFGASAKVVRPLSATNREDASAAGTEVDARTREAAHEDVTDLLLEVPGAHPVRTGWLGSFTSASLRGADVDHTDVLLGDIPISSADAAAFNLSTIPVSVLDRVVVYRGGAPAWLSQGAVGGVIQLVPRSAETTALSGTMSAGSFGTFGAAAESEVVPKTGHGPVLLTAAGVIGSRADFTYVDDNNTTLDTRDDHLSRRHNAEFLDGHGLLHLRQALGPGDLELVLLGYEHAAGEPGSPAHPALQAHRNFTRGVTGINYTIERTNTAGERVLRLQALAAGTATRSVISDLGGELGPGIPRVLDAQSTRTFERLAASAAAAGFLELTLIATAQQEQTTSYEPLARVPLPDSTRTTLATVAEASLHGRIAGHRVDLRPSVRLEQSNARLNSERFGALVVTRNVDTLPTYRAAFALELTRDLTFSSSAASGARTPSILELFGDGALLAGNTALQPERSKSYDASLVMVTCHDAVAGSFELRAFALDIEDEIVFKRASFNQLQPFNLGNGQVRGLEAGARADFGRHLWLNGATTLLDTAGPNGKHLPNRPGATFLVQPGVTSGAVGPFDALHAFVESRYTATSYDDPDNAALPKPSQIFFDVGTTLVFARKRAQLRLTASDIFDRRGSDLRDFPLPGRTLMASLTYKEDLR
jgi:outer membrane receptor protein involved in Fe transport